MKNDAEGCVQRKLCSCCRAHLNITLYLTCLPNLSIFLALQFCLPLVMPGEDLVLASHGGIVMLWEGFNLGGSYLGVCRFCLCDELNPVQTNFLRPLRSSGCVTIQPQGTAMVFVSCCTKCGTWGIKDFFLACQDGLCSFSKTYKKRKQSISMSDFKLEKQEIVTWRIRARTISKRIGVATYRGAWCELGKLWFAKKPTGMGNPQGLSIFPEFTSAALAFHQCPFAGSAQFW